MPSQFSETAPGGTVSGTRTLRRQSRGLIVEYVLEWTGSEPVAVRLADRIPTSAVEEYGFHEDHEPAEWSITDGELDLEAVLDPEEERRLVLGLVADDGVADALDGDEPVVDVLDGDGSGEPDAAEPAGADGPDVDLSVDLEDSGSGERRQEDVDQGSGRSTGGRRVDADGGVVNRDPADGDDVAAKLVAELEAGTVPESELSTLRDHLADGAGSEAVRLEYVQKRLSDFDAYVDALEDLLSVHGSGDDAITDLDERFDGLADDVDAVRRRQDELAERLDGLSDALDEQAATLESHRVTHEADVEDLRTEIRRRSEVLCEEFNDLQQSLDADLAALEAEIGAFESIRRTLVDGLQRPGDLRAATTVEDADPGAPDGTEETPIVDPAETDDGDDAAVEFEATEDDPALESGVASDVDDDADAPGVDQPEVSVDLEESLEAAEASNFSTSAGGSEDDAGGSGSGEGEDDDGQFDGEFVHPSPDGRGVTEAADGERSGAATWEDDGGDAGDGTGEEFVVPAPDVDDADGTDGTPEDEEATPDAAAGAAPDEDGGDGDDDDTDGPASSIFEIGDVDSDGSAADEMPTIDFEDP